MLRSWVAIVVVVLTLLCEGSALAEEPKDAPDLVAIADPDFVMEGNVRTFMSLGRVLRRYEDLFPKVSEGQPAFFGVLVRFARFGFLDWPLADVESIVIHEVAGHGARAREFGKSPTFTFKLPQPYRGLFSPSDEEQNFARRRDGGTRGTDADIAVGLGGVESNYLTAHWTNLNVVASGGSMHLMDGLVYVTSKASYFDSFVGENLATAAVATGNDIISYASALADRFNQFTLAQRQTVASHVQTAYIWNLADPMLLWAFWATFYEGIGRGHRVTTMPLPKVFGHYAYLSPRFALSPFGAEHYVDLFVAPSLPTHGRRWVSDLYVRVGSSGLASYVGAGTKVLEVPIGLRFRAGGELDVWSQPIFDRGVRAYYDRPSSLGMNAAAIASVSIIGPLSITGKLGYKSTGFVMGLPIGDGPHGYLGVALRP